MFKNKLFFRFIKSFFLILSVFFNMISSSIKKEPTYDNRDKRQIGLCRNLIEAIENDEVDRIDDFFKSGFNL